MTKTIIGAGVKDTARKFVKDIEKGKYGEYLFKKYLAEHYEGDIDICEDKSDVHKYQRADIDLLVRFKKRDTIIGIEVKNDSTLYPNLFFETVSAVRKGKKETPGCMVISEADTLYYIYDAVGIAAVVPLTKLRQWVMYYRNTGAYYGAKVVGNEEYKAEGHPIPLRHLLGKNPKWKPLPGIKLVDLEKDEEVSYEEYDKRRQQMYVRAGKKFYVEIKPEPAWDSKTLRLWPDTEMLDIEVRSELERRTYANTYRNKLKTKKPNT